MEPKDKIDIYYKMIICSLILMVFQKLGTMGMGTANFYELFVPNIKELYTLQKMVYLFSLWVAVFGNILLFISIFLLLRESFYVILKRK